MDEIEEARDDAEVKTSVEGQWTGVPVLPGLSHHQTTKNKGEGERVSVERARQGRAGMGFGGVWLVVVASFASLEGLLQRKKEEKWPSALLSS